MTTFVSGATSVAGTYGTFTINPDGSSIFKLGSTIPVKFKLAGASAGFEHVVYVRIFLTEFDRDYAAVNRLYVTYFPSDRLPARTTVGVTRLARGGIVEIDMIAYKPRPQDP